MDAKYQKYYDKLKGANLSSKVTPVTSGCNSLKTNTTKLGTQVSEATWKELGLDQVKTAVIPADKSKILNGIPDGLHQFGGIILEGKGIEGQRLYCADAETPHDIGWLAVLAVQD